MVIQHIFSKNSCMSIQLLVSVKDVPLFHHSNFYLYSILFASPASIYTVFFSLVQLLFNKESFITPTSIYIVIGPIIFITPGCIYAVLLLLIQLILLSSTAFFSSNQRLFLLTQHIIFFITTSIYTKN